jgi:HipA-like C-terminal domain
LRAPPVDPIKYYADYQLNWAALIPPLRPGRYIVEDAQDLSIHGDAPKFFVRVKEYQKGRRSRGPRDWPKYIAKVGSKWYPVESITEQLIGTVGECYGFAVARSDLRMIGYQVRFMSRYFLMRNELLTHGVEIFAQHVQDRKMIEEIAENRLEQEFYTFQTIFAMITAAFPEHHGSIMDGLVAMIAYDALVGNNDRHPANWGVVVGVERGTPIRFSPIFDTARALFWNSTEEAVRRISKVAASFDRYVRKCYPQIGWDGVQRIDHFELIDRIWQGYPQYRPVLKRFATGTLLASVCKEVPARFAHLLSEERLALVERCLRRRHEMYCATVQV